MDCLCGTWRSVPYSDTSRNTLKNAISLSKPASEAIADLSASRYFEDVKYLSRDEMKGRGDGSPELDKAADYIASQFRKLGLRPMGDDNTYFQKFQLTTGAKLGPNNTLEVN